MLTYSEIINPTDERLKRILLAGEAHFKRDGFRRASLDSICKQAGISKPTFYKYFNKKETLLFAVSIYLSREWFSRYDERTREVQTATDKLSAFLEVTEEYFRSTSLLTETFRTSPELYKSWAGHPLNVENYLARVDFVEKIIREGIASDEFRVSDPRRTAHVIVLSSMLFVIFEPEMPGIIKKTDASFLFDLLQHGITKHNT